jgi:ribosomal protein S12 methylthiotransferase
MELLEAIDAIDGDFTYRVYYLYPDILTLDHLAKLKKLKKLLPYFDIPFQHISANVLKLMGRHYDQEHIFSFLDTIRHEFPDSFIRTSFIIGFPGETDENFQELCDFIQKYQFESVGIFQYHDEPLAASSKLQKKVSEDIAKSRIERLTPLLESIYTSKTASRKGINQHGYVMEVRDHSLIVRPELHAPEVDEYDEIPLPKQVPEIGKYIEYIL